MTPDDLRLARGEWTSIAPRDAARAELLRAIGLAASGHDQGAHALACSARDRARLAGDQLGGAVAARIAGLLKIRTGREVAGTNEVESADAELDLLGVPRDPRAQLPGSRHDVP
jgi:hypothetical protein